MLYVPGGSFRMGADDGYPEEAPSQQVRVDGFWIDETPVTNAQFAAFVAETGYRTVAETPPDPRDYPGIRPEMIRAGSLVFRKTAAPVANMSDVSQWWDYCFGADWRHPTGPESSIEGIGDHPVVHIAYADAEAYANWADKALPTETEWEYAARGGLDGATFAWGDELAPGGAMMANYWQGTFPHANDMLDGWERTSPVHSYPANGHGLYDMIGNVWEWTTDWYAARQPERKKKGQTCCIPSNPRGPVRAASLDRTGPQPRMGRKVLKGGSHLCAENYCQRYRPAARHPQPTDTSTSHVGFRCVRREGADRRR